MPSLKSTIPQWKRSCKSGRTLQWLVSPASQNFWIDKPVIAINTAIYWHALRQSGVTDRVPGFGSLLGEH
jgi:maleate isomerase